MIKDLYRINEDITCFNQLKRVLSETLKLDVNPLNIKEITDELQRYADSKEILTSVVELNESGLMEPSRLRYQLINAREVLGIK